MSMTENEIIKMLEVEKAYMDSHGGRSQSEALAYAIESVKEIQQYRTIGTVEDLKSMKENGAFTGVELAQLAAMQMRLKEYSAIGTIEEFKALKDKSVAKKAIPNKPLEEGDYIKWTCPNCGRIRWKGYYFQPLIFDKVCTNCLQAIDWQ